jgi:hypothetical protein
MIEVSEKYTLEVSSPTAIASERQPWGIFMDQLASKDSPTKEEEKYAEVLLALIEAYEEEHPTIRMLRR